MFNLIKKLFCKHKKVYINELFVDYNTTLEFRFCCKCNKDLDNVDDYLKTVKKFKVKKFKED